MNKLSISFLVFVMAISLVLAAQGDAGIGYLEESGSDTDPTAVSGSAQAGQENNGSQVNVQIQAQTQNKGAETALQNQEQVRVRSGNYESSNGEQMQIQTENGFKLKVGNSEAKSSLAISQEQDQTQNRTKLKTQLSNGRNAEIKVMPNTASERAIERLQLKNCNSENNCSIELKEVGSGEQVRAAYEIQAQKDSKVFGLFKKKMNVQAQVDAETGEVLESKKPWWAFIASE
jgi:hypothetical protein